MNRIRRRAAVSRAVDSVCPTHAYLCEQLEPRRLLDGNDPVIVLVEPVQNYVVDDVLPYLWTNPEETPFDPHVNGDPPPDTLDGDGNNRADDAYGWNFLTDSPVFAYPDDNEHAGHGTIITNTVLNLLPTTSRVKIMYVVTHLTNDIHSDGELRDGSEALDYILENWIGKRDTATYDRDRKAGHCYL